MKEPNYAEFKKLIDGLFDVRNDLADLVATKFVYEPTADHMEKIARELDNLDDRFSALLTPFMNIHRDDLPPKNDAADVGEGG